METRLKPFYSSEEIQELMVALCKAQEEVKPAKKTGKAHYGAYATLADVIDEIQPVANKYGLVIWTGATFRDGVQLSVTTLFHTSGQWLSSEYCMGHDLGPQDIGSAQTYFRRYAQQGNFNQPCEDDDGVTAQKGFATNSTEKRKDSNWVGGPTESQLKRLYAISKASNWSPTDVKEYLHDLGVENSKELNQLQYQKLCDTMQKYPRLSDGNQTSN